MHHLERTGQGKRAGRSLTAISTVWFLTRELQGPVFVPMRHQVTTSVMPHSPTCECLKMGECDNSEGYEETEDRERHYKCKTFANFHEKSISPLNSCWVLTKSTNVILIWPPSGTKWTWITLQYIQRWLRRLLVSQASELLDFSPSVTFGWLYRSETDGSFKDWSDVDSEYMAQIRCVTIRPWYIHDSIQVTILTTGFHVWRITAGICRRGWQKKIHLSPGFSVNLIIQMLSYRYRGGGFILTVSLQINVLFDDYVNFHLSHPAQICT